MIKNKIAILVNAHAHNGQAFKNWTKIKEKNNKLFTNTDIKIINIHDNILLTHNWVLKNLRLGVRKFIAVGGDGTLNILLNLLVTNSQHILISLEDISLGAIGVGSSNDFHKPPHIQYAGFPCRIDWQNSALKDILYCSSWAPENKLQYFLINASIGITAQANYLFNFPPPWLKYLKKFNINAAIIFAALYAILSYKNININIEINKIIENSFQLTNLAAVKNRHFAGSFRYDQGAEFHDNYFMLHLCKNMWRYEAVRTLINLAQGKFKKTNKTESILAQNICIKSSQLFCLELDGEVIRSQHCEIGVHSQKIRLCL